MLILHLKTTRDTIFKGYTVILSNEGHTTQLVRIMQLVNKLWLDYYENYTWHKVKTTRFISKIYMTQYRPCIMDQALHHSFLSMSFFSFIQQSFYDHRCILNIYSSTYLKVMTLLNFPFLLSFHLHILENKVLSFANVIIVILSFLNCCI